MKDTTLAFWKGVGATLLGSLVINLAFMAGKKTAARVNP